MTGLSHFSFVPDAFVTRSYGQEEYKLNLVKFWLFRKRYADVHSKQFGESKQVKSPENPLVHLMGGILNPEEPKFLRASDVYKVPCACFTYIRTPCFVEK